MGVKRFDFIQECDSNDGWLEEAALGQYVLASDYATLEARCRELEMECHREHNKNVGYLDRIAEMETSLEKYQACRVHDVDEKAWLSKRMTELEAQCASKDRVIADLDFNVFPKLDDRIEQLEAALREYMKWRPAEQGSPLDLMARSALETGGEWDCVCGSTGHKRDARCLCGGVYENSASNRGVKP